MEWKKAPEELVTFLAQKMKNIKCEYKKMFGYPAYFINGNMFAGIHGEKLLLRLSESDVKEILSAQLNVTCFEPVQGKPMTGYVVLPKLIRFFKTIFGKVRFYSPFFKFCGSIFRNDF